MFVKRTVLTLFSILMLLIIIGCINYEQKIKFREDLSGITYIHYWAIGTAEDENLPPGYPFSEDAIEEAYGDIDGISLSDVKVEVISEGQDDYTHCHMNIEFDDFDDFLKTDIGSFSPKSYYKKTNGGYKFYGVLVEETEEEDLSIYEEYTYDITITMPGDIVETNGKKSGKKVSWHYNLADIMKSDETIITAVSE